MAEKQAFHSLDISSTPDIVTGDVETQGFDGPATKKLLRKLDWHLIPFMSLIYLYVPLRTMEDHATYTLPGFASLTALILAMRASIISNWISSFTVFNITIVSPSSSLSTSRPKYHPTS